MTDAFGVGIIGCGNISTTYFRLAPLFRGIEMRACADLSAEAAQARADEFGLRALSMDQMLADSEIDIVVNLTVPDAHFTVSRDILSAGKHLYSEKPLTLTVEDGLTLRRLAEDNSLTAGCTPDTFLGGAHQLSRQAIDDGRIGRVVAGTAHVMGHGMEHWHPNPDFFYKPGGGPVLDVGPYYISCLVNLLGPVSRVAALAAIPEAERTITSEPRAGETITVETPTDVHALLQFASGGAVTFSASWNVWAHRHGNMELYGTEGSLFLPDPNFFGGEVLATNRGDPAAALPETDHPLGVPNQKHSAGMQANYRTAGLADMAQAIRNGTEPRCSLDLALHGVDVMTSILRSGETGAFVDIETTCSQPAALTAQQARELLA